MEKNREPKVNLHIYDRLSYDMGIRNIWWRNILFNKWCWENWTATSIRMKLDHCFIPYTKVNSKWIKYLNIRPKTINLLEENINPLTSILVMVFWIWHQNQRQQKQKKKKKKLDYNKWKCLCTENEASNKLKANLLNGRKCVQTIGQIRC